MFIQRREEAEIQATDTIYGVDPTHEGALRKEDAHLYFGAKGSGMERLDPLFAKLDIDCDDKIDVEEYR